MATVIDALVVTLGLDAKGFKRGSDDAGKSLKKTRDEADKTAKDLEAKGKQAARFFGEVKGQALSLLAVFTAGLGFKAFATNAMQSSAQLQNLSGNLGMSASDLDAWGKTFERAGGTAAEAVSLFTSAATDIGKVKTGQGVSEALRAIQRYGGSINEAIKGPRAFVLEEARVLEKLNALNPEMARAAALQMGLNDAQFAILKVGPAALESQIAAQRQIIGLSDEQTAQLAELNKQWADFKTKLEAVADKALMGLADSGALDDLLKIFEGLVKAGAFLVRELIDLDKATNGWSTRLLVLLPLLQMLGAGALVGGVLALAGAFLTLGTNMAAAVASGGSLAAILGRLGLAGVAGVGGYAAGTALNDEINRRLSEATGRSTSLGSWIYDQLHPEEAKPGSGVADIAKKAEAFAGNLADSLFGKLIAKGEGGYNSVNRGTKGGYKAGWEPLENMTVAEVMAAQQAGKFNAAGHWQIIKGTLADAAKTLGLSGNEKFDQATQDRIFEEYLVKHKRKTIWDYLNGKSDDLMGAVKAISMEWASVANPETGRSYYAGIGNNRASTGYQEMARALEMTRTQLFPVGARALGSSAPSVGGNSSTEVKIGQITIQTKATDAQGIARDARDAFARHPMIVPQANAGLG